MDHLEVQCVFRLSGAGYNIDLIGLEAQLAEQWIIVSQRSRGFDSYRGQANFSACPEYTALVHSCYFNTSSSFRLSETML